MAKFDEENAKELLEEALELSVTKEIEERYRLILEINEEKLRKRKNRKDDVKKGYDDQLVSSTDTLGTTFYDKVKDLKPLKDTSKTRNKEEVKG